MVETNPYKRLKISPALYLRIIKDGYISEKNAEKIPEDQRQILAEILITERIKKVIDDPAFFMFNYVMTLDTHDKLVPVKAMPDKEYIYYIIKTWEKTPLLLIPKSRQMMISWVTVGLHYWLAAFHPGKYIFFQSKKEEDADTLLERAKFIHDHLPDWLRPNAKKSYCWFAFPEINSKIQAVSQESDAIRSQTASAILCDEMAFQPYAQDAFAASQPTIVGGGKFTGVSTANGRNFFYNLCYDLEA